MTVFLTMAGLVAALYLFGVLICWLGEQTEVRWSWPLFLFGKFVDRFAMWLISKN